MIAKTWMVLAAVGSSLAGTSQAQHALSIVDFRPAPGQYANLASGLPADAETALGPLQDGDLVSLGAWGGYVVFEMDKDIENDPDNPYGVDFTIFGNAFSGFAELGVVYVMDDENGNGQPDDTWYEIAGSLHSHPDLIRDYSVTYTDPEAVDTQVDYVDNQGQQGFVETNAFREAGSSYFPQAGGYPDYPSGQVVFDGTLLPLITAFNAEFEFTEYLQADYGYADNHPIGDLTSALPDDPATPELEGMGGDAMDLDWAVNALGQPVALDQVRWVRIQTGIQGNTGFGELSTEVSGLVDIDPPVSVQGSNAVALQLHPNPATHLVTLQAKEVTSVLLVNAQGQAWPVAAVAGSIAVGHLPRGVYTLVATTPAGPRRSRLVLH